VDEAALVTALKDGTIAARGWTCSTRAAKADNPLFGLPNVILSPHSAGLTVECVIRMATHAAQAIIDVLEGVARKALSTGGTAVVSSLLRIPAGPSAARRRAGMPRGSSDPPISAATQRSRTTTPCRTPKIPRDASDARYFGRGIRSLFGHACVALPVVLQIGKR